MHGNGEILACRAAQAAGIPYTLSTMSICSIEDVAGAVDKPFWFQLYVMKDRGFVRALIERAIAAKCSALVLTVDLQVLGQRHADLRNGLAVPPSLKLKNLLNMATKPRMGLQRAYRQELDLRQPRRPCERHGGRQVAGGMDLAPVRRHPELERRRVDPQHLAGQADHQGHSRCRRCQARGRDGRRGDRRFQPWRPPARRRAFVDLDVAQDRRCGGLADRGPVRRRHPLRPGRDARRWRSAPRAA